MLSQFGARPAVVGPLACRQHKYRRAVLAAATGASVALGGCLPTRAPLAGADPADPAAKVAPVGYRSTVAPYSTLRPVAPSSWRERNERAAPKSEQ
jgi:hypothetical protein